MKIPLSWISLYTPLSSLIAKKSIKDIAHEYSIHTAEIDGISEHFLDKVVIGKMISCEKHPESKKLSICEVDIGAHGKTIILTGAANIVDAIYVPVAVVGAVLPGDFVIADRMMAGHMSSGMICGADEIGMSTQPSTGIMILEDIWDRELLEKMVGQSFFDLTLPLPGLSGEIYQFPLRDTTFEIDNKFITNRPDLFSVVGNAREFGAVFDLPFVPYIDTMQTETIEIPVDIATHTVLAYHLYEIQGISVRESPMGISLMMERSGLTSKLDIVDITNMVMTELGQPMHVYDRDTIVGNIVVRMAKSGEKFIALDDREYTLTPADIVIADSEKILALAGIIGAKSSSVTENTKNIIWESACFDAVTVRLSATRHGIRTDASMRYEKSIDPLLSGTTLTRVMDYLSFLGKSTDITGVSHFQDDSQVRHITIEVTEAFIDIKAGLHIASETKEKILTALGFLWSKTDDTYTITVPTWRASKDISIQEDIAEEIARIYGYEQTPLTPLDANFSISQKNPSRILRSRTLNYFSALGASEVYSYSFTSQSLHERALMNDLSGLVKIQNAFNEEYTHMTNSLAPRLFLALGENLKHTQNLFFIEIGKISLKNTSRKHPEKLLAGADKQPFFEAKVIAGVATEKTTEDLKKILEGYLRDILGYVPPIQSGTHLAFLHPGISGSYHLDSVEIARFGRIHPEVAANFSLPEDTLYFEIDFSELLSLSREKEVFFRPISKYQTTSRELNFIMNEHTQTGDIAREIDALHPWISQVVVDSVYRDDEKIGKEKKSVSFGFLLSRMDGTIQDSEALEIQNTIIAHMQEKGFEIRGI